MVAFCGRLIYFQVALSLSANEKVRSHLSPVASLFHFLRKITFLGKSYFSGKLLSTAKNFLIKTKHPLHFQQSNLNIQKVVYWGFELRASRDGHRFFPNQEFLATLFPVVKIFQHAHKLKDALAEYKYETAAIVT